MALARFFAKNVIAAHSVLPDVTYDSFAAALEAQRIGVCVPDEALTREGRVLARLLVNLLARLYPRLALLGSDRATADLAALARTINPAIELDTRAEDVETSVSVGGGRAVGGTPLYASSQGWVARFDTAPLDPPGSSANSIGAAVAACIAAANVFRASFRAQLQHAPLDRALALSAYDFARAAANGPALPETIDLTGTHLVGAGAIGNAFLWLLAELPQLHGVLPVIDSEAIDLGNLQRYVLTRDADADGTTRKVLRAEEALMHTNVLVRPHDGTWGAYLRAAGTDGLERICVALDTARDRLAVQAALPRATLNAWTQTGDLGVSRHAFLGDEACLACVYLPTGEVPSEDALVAQALGLTQDIMTVRRLLYTGDAVDEALLAVIAQHLHVDFAAVAAFRGKPLRALYQDGICGGVLLPFGAQLGGGRAVATPLAFQSALAGVLLASELVIAAVGLMRDVRTATSINLLQPIGSEGLCRRKPKHSSRRCLCHDDDYIRRYREKWSI
jgi:hypothetical protein